MAGAQPAPAGCVTDIGVGSSAWFGSDLFFKTSWLKVQEFVVRFLERFAWSLRFITPVTSFFSDILVFRFTGDSRFKLAFFSEVKLATSLADSELPSVKYRFELATPNNTHSSDVADSGLDRHTSSRENLKLLGQTNSYCRTSKMSRDRVWRAACASRMRDRHGRWL